MITIMVSLTIYDRNNVIKQIGSELNSSVIKSDALGKKRFHQ